MELKNPELPLPPTPEEKLDRLTTVLDTVFRDYGNLRNTPVSERQAIFEKAKTLQTVVAIMEEEARVIGYFPPVREEGEDSDSYTNRRSTAVVNWYQENGLKLMGPDNLNIIFDSALNRFNEDKPGNKKGIELNYSPNNEEPEEGFSANLAKPPTPQIESTIADDTITTDNTEDTTLADNEKASSSLDVNMPPRGYEAVDAEVFGITSEIDPQTAEPLIFSLLTQSPANEADHYRLEDLLTAQCVGLETAIDNLLEKYHKIKGLTVKVDDIGEISIKKMRFLVFEDGYKIDVFKNEDEEIKKLVLSLNLRNPPDISHVEYLSSSGENIARLNHGSPDWEPQELEIFQLMLTKVEQLLCMAKYSDAKG